MSKKKTDKSKSVLLPIDRLSIQLGFMDTLRAGYLIQMIVNYVMGDTETLNRLTKEVEKLDDSYLVLMAYQEDKAVVDQNLASYAEKCEINRKNGEKNKEAWREFREYQMQKKGTDRSQSVSKGIDRSQSVAYTDTNTNTNTNTDTNTDTNSSSLHSEEKISLSPIGENEREASEVISFINNNCSDNLATLAPLTIQQAIWIYKSCSRSAWRKILSDLDDTPDLKKKHLKQFKAFETYYNHRKANGTLELQ